MMHALFSEAPNQTHMRSCLKHRSVPYEPPQGALRRRASASLSQLYCNDPPLKEGQGDAGQPSLVVKAT